MTFAAALARKISRAANLAHIAQNDARYSGMLDAPPKDRNLIWEEVIREHLEKLLRERPRLAKQQRRGDE